MANDQQALQAVRTLFEWLGENPDREGLQETPARFLKAWKEEWGRGYAMNEEELATVIKSFSVIDKTSSGDQELDEMVLVRDMVFHSHCEHHMAPFFGVAHIAYVGSGNRVLGLSKLARIVDYFASRLQVQERITNQVADFLHYSKLNPQGVGVVMEAQHLCMCSRGVKKVDSKTVTSALRGCIRTEPETRAEFMKLVYR